MDEITKINLSEQTIFRLDEISKIKNYFIKEINQRKSCSQKLNKYFDYIDKSLVEEYQVYYWNSSRNSKCKFCFNFFFNNRNS